MPVPERFLFCIVGVLAIIAIFVNMSHKKPLPLALSQLFTVRANVTVIAGHATPVRLPAVTLRVQRPTM